MFEHAIWSRTDDHQPCQCPGKRIMIGSSPSCSRIVATYSLNAIFNELPSCLLVGETHLS